MKNMLVLIVGLVIVLMLAMQFTLFQLPYNERAVVTTFGEAGENSIKEQPGLYFRWPPPIQSVRRYSTNLQMLETRKQELTTLDNHSVVISAYIAWQIEDPRQFYLTLDSVSKARDQIDALYRDLGMIGRYRLDQIVNAEDDTIRLAEIERELTDMLAKRVQENSAGGYGISIKQVGIRGIELPEDVTEKVFERMNNEREALAAKTRGEGESQAESITTEAETIRDRIMAFANNYADRLRAEGDKEAAELYSVFSENEELARLLKRIETIPKLLGGDKTPATIFLDPSDLDLFGGQVEEQPTPAKVPVSDRVAG